MSACVCEWRREFECNCERLTTEAEYRKQIENEALERAALHFDEMNSYADLSASIVVNAIRALKG
jgi:spore coat polysaccharide biosynthesis predicted glycosyltransferase SpsG